MFVLRVVFMVVEVPKLVHPVVLEFNANNGIEAGKVLSIVVLDEEPVTLFVTCIISKPSTVSKFLFQLLLFQKLNFPLVVLYTNTPSVGVGTVIWSVSSKSGILGISSPLLLSDKCNAEEGWGSIPSSVLVVIKTWL